MSAADSPTAEAGDDVDAGLDRRRRARHEFTRPRRHDDRPDATGDAGADRPPDRGVGGRVAAGWCAVPHAAEQFLHWHHCHRTDLATHRPLGFLILLADGLHNFIGGLAVGGAFVVDTRVGVVAWLVAAAHEVPQELGDFGVLLHSGWRRRSALLWNFASALTFLVGSLVAYAVAEHVEVAYLLPFAAGNFVYIAAADLLPEISSHERTRDKVETTAAFVAGLLVLLAATSLA